MERPIVIVLDTHAWVWWLTKPDKLAKKAARAIERADRVGIPSICTWEVAMKAEAGKLRFDRPYDVWIDEALAEDERIDLLHLSPRICVDAVRLPWAHQDPADRLIVATSRGHDAVLVTADEQIRLAQLARCVWD
jgi:PIN domain nuclease of toxin-antitoxin system